MTWSAHKFKNSWNWLIVFMLTNFKYEAYAITGNGNDVFLLNCVLKKFVISLYVNKVLAEIIHWEPLRASRQWDLKSQKKYWLLSNPLLNQIHTTTRDFSIIVMSKGQIVIFRCRGWFFSHHCLLLPSPNCKRLIRNISLRCQIGATRTGKSNRIQK